MIPIIIKLQKNDKDYKYGVRWAIVVDEYIFKVSNFKKAFYFWKKELELWINKK